MRLPSIPAPPFQHSFVWPSQISSTLDSLFAACEPELSNIARSQSQAEASCYLRHSYFNSTLCSADVLSFCGAFRYTLEQAERHAEHAETPTCCLSRSPHRIPVSREKEFGPVSGICRPMAQTEAWAIVSLRAKTKLDRLLRKLCQRTECQWIIMSDIVADSRTCQVVVNQQSPLTIPLSGFWGIIIRHDR